MIHRESSTIEFEVAYLTICNMLTLVCMIQIILLYRKINEINELYGAKLDDTFDDKNLEDPDRSVQSHERSLNGPERDDHNSEESHESLKRKYHRKLVHMLTFYMTTYILKIMIFILLAFIYLFSIGRDNSFYHYIGMTSSLNYRFLSCDVHKDSVSGRPTTF